MGWWLDCVILENLNDSMIPSWPLCDWSLEAHPEAHLKPSSWAMLTHTCVFLLLSSAPDTATNGFSSKKRQWKDLTWGDQLSSNKKHQGRSKFVAPLPVTESRAREADWFCYGTGSPCFFLIHEIFIGWKHSPLPPATFKSSEPCSVFWMNNVGAAFGSCSLLHITPHRCFPAMAVMDTCLWVSVIRRDPVTAFHISSNPSTAAQRLCSNPQNIAGLSTRPQQGSIQTGSVLSEQYKTGLKAPMAMHYALVWPQAPGGQNCSLGSI